MGFDDLTNKFKPRRLLVVTILSSVYFIFVLILSHISHSLTLLINSYHMLCNIIALFGYLITIKSLKINSEKSKENGTVSKKVTTKVNKKLINTFGWIRINILIMLISFILITSFCFTLLVAAAQALVHINHYHKMHYPLFVLIVGFIGLILNAISQVLIGGYTFSQNSFAYIQTSENIINDNYKTDPCKEPCINFENSVPRQNPTLFETFHDYIGCIFVMICSILVYFSNDDIGKFLDPVIAIISAVVLILLNYSTMKESGYILLQTIPDSINIDEIRKDIRKKFPQIINLHDFHIWQLTSTKIIATVHIIFNNLNAYANIKNDLLNIFNKRGITHVTIQPEFTTGNNIEENLSKKQCLIKCVNDVCNASRCCPSVVIIDNVV